MVECQRQRCVVTVEAVDNVAGPHIDGEFVVRNRASGRASEYIGEERAALGKIFQPLAEGLHLDIIGLLGNRAAGNRSNILAVLRTGAEPGSLQRFGNRADQSPFGQLVADHRPAAQFAGNPVRQHEADHPVAEAAEVAHHDARAA